MRHIQAPAGARTVDSHRLLFASTEVAHTILFLVPEPYATFLGHYVHGSNSLDTLIIVVALTLLLVGFVADWNFATSADAIPLVVAIMLV